MVYVVTDREVALVLHSRATTHQPPPDPLPSPVVGDARQRPRRVAYRQIPRSGRNNQSAGLIDKPP
jgi:hypothetical protein